MDQIMEKLRGLLGGLSNSNTGEWRKTPPRAESPFAAELGLGTLQAEYTRTSSSSLTLILIGIGPMGVALILLLPDILKYHQYGSLLILLVAFVGTGFFISTRNRKPSELPRQVALFSGGIAWLDQGQLQELSWQQIKAARIQDNRYTIETTDGRLIVFNASLSRTDVGKAIQSAIGSKVTNDNAQDVIVLVIVLSILALIVCFFVFLASNPV
jgi:hypothetical protein